MNRRKLQPQHLIHSGTPTKDQILQRRALDLARPLQHLIDEEETVELVKFRLGREIYGMPLASLTGFHRALPITPLPHTPRHLLGLCSVRGEPVCVFDLRSILGAGSTTLSAETWLIGIENEFVVPVDEILGECGVKFSALSEVPRLVDGGASLLRGLTPDGLAVIDVAVLLDHPQAKIAL